MHISRVILFVALAALATTLPGGAQSAPRQIITRNALGPVIVWDATPQVEGFITNNIPYDRGVAQLKVHALELFVHGAQSFAKHEHHLSVTVVYARSGAINARYQTKSFQGIGNVLTLEGSPRIKLGADWLSKAQNGAFPSAITVHVAPPPSS